MRFQACFLSLAAAVICTVEPAAAQSPWYIEGSAGALWRMDASRSTTFFNAEGLTGAGTNTATFDPGPVVNLGIGYRLPLGFRVEAEFGYAHYGLNTVSPLSTDGAFPQLNGGQLSLQSGGGHDQYSGTVNAFYDLQRFGSVTPYIGTGVGLFATNAATAIFAGPGVSKFTQLGGHATNAGIIAEAGASIAIAPKWDIVPAYRYQYQVSKSGAFSSDANIFKLGLRYSM
jgi:opacity protein-like surface antigen